MHASFGNFRIVAEYLKASAGSRFMCGTIALQVALPLCYSLESIRIEIHGLLNFKRVARKFLIGSGIGCDPQGG
jgi:hypothetical protein